jgi:hypothetical protein
MTIVGAELLERLFAGEIHQAKMVFNARGAVVFPVARQHRQMKAEGISYEDNYAGNALAAMLRRDAIEIRFHQAFSDRALARIVQKLLTSPELGPLAGVRVTYQGRALAGS